jgi:macrodomain Ter protein organizer (MatP/YcbG family)
MAARRKLNVSASLQGGPVMPRKATSKNGAAVKGKLTKKGSREGEPVARYFQAVFKENPKWLKSRSNNDLLQRWLADHPSEPEVPDRIKNIMANTKSVLRKKHRKGRGKKAMEQSADAVALQNAVATLAAVPATSTLGHGFEQLEEQIDDCLTLAKNLDREGLESVIHLLRRARNEVVWKLGQ